jgi:hypothetical protein
MPQEEVVPQGVNAFLDWEKENKVKWIESELLIYSKEHDYCGRADAIAKIGSKPTSSTSRLRTGFTTT